MLFLCQFSNSNSNYLGYQLFLPVAQMWWQLYVDTHTKWGKLHKSSENPKRDFLISVSMKEAGGGQAGNMAAVCGGVRVWREQQPDSGLVDVHGEWWHLQEMRPGTAFKDAALKLQFLSSLQCEYASVTEENLSLSGSPLFVKTCPASPSPRPRALLKHSSFCGSRCWHHRQHRARTWRVP